LLNKNNFLTDSSIAGFINQEESTMSDFIKTDCLTKYYGKVHAVDGLSLSVRKGEIYGFLGLNGAGKTTTIRLLLGMIRPTSGASFLDGKRVDAGEYQLWKNVGYLVEIPYSYPELTVSKGSCPLDARDLVLGNSL
jgi:ABC-2 type transport system ATP-binding protein